MAAVHLWIECGSADEEPGEEGLAHFLEHMVFKGTAKRGIGGSAAAIEALGGELEAFTSEDQTELEATVGAEGWADALEVLADLAQAPRFDADEVAREIPVVIEEIRADLDDPAMIAGEALEHLLFDRHPYARSILGTPASVAAFTAARTARFWERGWGAGRAWLAVVGPVDASSVLPMAQRHFGQWRRGSSRAPVSDPGPLPADRAAVVTRRSLETSAVQLGWRIPGVEHPDQAALDVTSALLGHGGGALLPVRLQVETGFAAGVWSDTTWRLHGSQLSIGWFPTVEHVAESVTAAVDEVLAVARGRTAGRLVAQARDLMAADLLFSHETVEGRAADLLWHRIRTGRSDGAEHWRRSIAATTADDVQRAAATWLQPERAVVSAVGPRVSAKALGKALRPPRPVAHPTGLVERTLAGGLRVRIQPDAQRVAAIRVLGLGGGTREVPRTAGSTRAWARMVTSGAGELDTVGWSEAVDALGGVVEASCSRGSAGISASFPAENLLDGADLVADLLTRPRFDAEAWERVQAELQEEVDTLPDEPDELAWERIWAALWPGHPWRLPGCGTAASLAAITPHRLAEVHGAWAQAENLVVAVCGRCDPDAVLAALEPVAAALPTGLRRPSELPPPGAPARGIREARAGHAQSHVFVAARAPGLGHPDRAALELGTAILTAQAGRLFLALREVRSLAYSVSAEYACEAGGGIFAATLATAPGRADEAADALQAELARFAADGPSREEVDRARRQAMGFLAASLQRVASRAADLAASAVFSLPSGLAGHRAALEAVGVADIRRAFSALALADPLVVVTRPG